MQDLRQRYSDLDDELGVLRDNHHNLLRDYEALKSEQPVVIILTGGSETKITKYKTFNEAKASFIDSLKDEIDQNPDFSIGYNHELCCILGRIPGGYEYRSWEDERCDPWSMIMLINREQVSEMNKSIHAAICKKHNICIECDEPLFGEWIRKQMCESCFNQ